MKLSYQTAIISYVDILGFQNLLNSDSPGHISKIIRLLKEAHVPSQEIKDLDRVEFQNFSDLVVRYTPIDTPANVQSPSGLLFSELLSLTYAQSRLVSDGIILRGAVTVGQIRRSRGVIYGPGLAEAYRLEKGATYPRIVLRPDILRLLRTDPRLRRHDFATEKKFIGRLIRIEDGYVFLDYLRGILSEYDDPEGFTDFLRRHRAVILDNLARWKRNAEIRKKYRWLAQYHNSTILRTMSQRVRRRTSLRRAFYNELSVPKSAFK